MSERLGAPGRILTEGWSFPLALLREADPPWQAGVRSGVNSEPKRRRLGPLVPFPDDSDGLDPMSARAVMNRRLASNEEDPPWTTRGAFFGGRRRLSYRQLALVDLGAIPRNLTRTSPCQRRCPTTSRNETSGRRPISFKEGNVCSRSPGVPTLGACSG